MHALSGHLLVFGVDTALSGVCTLAGKIASQCCHACLGGTRKASVTHKDDVAIWEAQGEPIVVRPTVPPA